MVLGGSGGGSGEVFGGTRLFWGHLNDCIRF